jgi:hypothetical protein
VSICLKKEHPVKRKIPVTAAGLAALLMTFGAPHTGRAAETMATSCSQLDTDLPAPLSAWAQKPVGVAAAISSKKLSGAVVTIGKKVTVTFAPSSSVSLILPPEKKLVADNSHAGLLAVRIPVDGDYRIILGKNGWIDVVVAGKLVPSISFGDNPKCSTIRKFVVFTLKAGDATIQLSGVSSSNGDVLVTHEK